MRDDLRFFLVELGVQNDVAHTLALQDVGEQFGLFSIDVVPTSTGCFSAWSRSISSATAKYFSFAVRIHNVGILDAKHLAGSSE